MNVLLITTDQQRYDALGCNGHPVVRTPHLDRLAQEGTSFTRHTCSNPMCTPARASIITGQYSRTHGAYECGPELDRTQTTLPQWLASAGWHCGIVGKTHFEAELNGRAAALPVGAPYYGFHEAHVVEDTQIGPYLNWIKAEHPQWYDEVLRNGLEAMVPGGLEKNGGQLNAAYKSKLPDEVHMSRWIADRSIEFLQRRKGSGSPFFLWTSFVDPHHPWNPVEPFASMYDPTTLPDPAPIGAHGGPTHSYNDASGLDLAEVKRIQALYYGMISHLDFHVGRILEALEASGMLNETLIIFTSDHGEFNGQHRMIRKMAGLYDDILHVPFIVRGPGVPAGARVHGLSQHEDLAPTILDLAGQAQPDSMQGHSMWPATTGKGTCARRYSYYEIGDMLGVADERWKVIAYQHGQRFVLTDRQTDPLELVDRANDETCQNELNRLKMELGLWLMRTPAWRLPKQWDF